MKKVFLALVAFVLCGLPPAWAQNPVVVELFTSEGCSSCPPADALLVQLSKGQPRGAELILLGEHVDYWNYIGWTDRFSSAELTRRQSDYGKRFHLASVYTPQMVIDGQVQFVGNDAGEVNRNIALEAAKAKPAHVSLHWESKTHLHVAVQTPTSERPRVLLAVTEDGLTTAVGGGENGGHTLHHAAVVRQLKELGTATNGTFAANVDVAQHAEWNTSALKVAVLVQDPASGKILGAASIAYQP